MGPHRNRPLLVTALKAALSLGAVAATFVAASAHAEDPIPPTPQQRLAAMESEYDAIMDEAAQLGTGDTIDESIRFSTNRQGQLRVDIDRFEAALRQRGASTEEITAARNKFRNQTVFGIDEAIKEGAEEVAVNAATKLASAALRRAVGVITLVGDVIEYGGKKYFKEVNVAALNEQLAQGRIQMGELLDTYSILNRALIAEINAQRRLRELGDRRRKLYEKIARERERLGMGAGRDAILRRDTDAAGDRALEEEARRERLNNSVRLSDPAEAAKRKAELDRGGRGVGPSAGPLSYVPGFGAQSRDFNAVLVTGYVISDFPTSTGIGFQRPSGGPEKFASRSHDDMELLAFGLMFFGDLGEDWVLDVAMQYAFGEDEDEGFVEDGTGIDTGFVYGDFSPGGSTGLNIGDRGLEWASDVDVASFNLEAKLARRSAGPATWFVYGDYLHIERDHNAWALGQVVFLGSTFNLIQERSQTVTDNLLGAGAGLQFGARPTPWLNLGGWVSGGVFYRWSELDSRERNVCGLCSGPDTDFTLGLDDKDDGVTWAVAAGLYGEVPLGDRVSIGLGVDASYIDEVAKVYNPSSGNDLFIDGKHTALFTDSMMTWGVRLGVKFQF